MLLVCGFKYKASPMRLSTTLLRAVRWNHVCSLLKRVRLASTLLLFVLSVNFGQFDTFELVSPFTTEEIKILRNAEANVSPQTGPLEFTAPPSASVAVLEYKPTVHGSLYDR